jgi:hypothetical protein
MSSHRAAARSRRTYPVLEVLVIRSAALFQPRVDADYDIAVPRDCAACQSTNIARTGTALGGNAGRLRHRVLDIAVEKVSGQIPCFVAFSAVAQSRSAADKIRGGYYQYQKRAVRSAAGVLVAAEH